MLVFPSGLLSGSSLAGGARVKAQPLIATKDPRETGQDYDFDAGVYFKDRDKYPKPSEEAKERLNLKDEYHYAE